MVLYKEIPPPKPKDCHVYRTFHIFRHTIKYAGFIPEVISRSFYPLPRFFFFWKGETWFPHVSTIHGRAGLQLNLGAILEVIVVNHHAVLRIKGHALRCWAAGAPNDLVWSSMNHWASLNDNICFISSISNYSSISNDIQWFIIVNNHLYIFISSISNNLLLISHMNCILMFCH